MSCNLDKYTDYTNIAAVIKSGDRHVVRFEAPTGECPDGVLTNSKTILVEGEVAAPVLSWSEQEGRPVVVVPHGYQELVHEDPAASSVWPLLCWILGGVLLLGVIVLLVARARARRKEREAAAKSLKQEAARARYRNGPSYSRGLRSHLAAPTYDNSGGGSRGDDLLTGMVIGQSLATPAPCSSSHNSSSYDDEHRRRDYSSSPSLSDSFSSSWSDTSSSFSSDTSSSFGSD